MPELQDSVMRLLKEQADNYTKGICRNVVVTVRTSTGITNGVLVALDNVQKAHPEKLQVT